MKLSTDNPDLKPTPSVQFKTANKGQIFIGVYKELRKVVGGKPYKGKPTFHNIYGFVVESSTIPVGVKQDDGTYAERAAVPGELVSVFATTRLDNALRRPEVVLGSRVQIEKLPNKGVAYDYRVDII